MPHAKQSDLGEIRRLCIAAAKSIQAHQIPCMLSKDDLIQEGMIKLWIFTKLNKESNHGYLVMVARRAMIDSIRSARWEGRDTDPDRQYKMVEQSDLQPEQSLRCDAIGSVCVMEIVAMINNMPSRAKEAANFLADGFSPSETADAMRVDRGRISQYRTELRELIFPLIKD